MKALVKGIALGGAGGTLYILIELLFRGKTHWTMWLVGGICFLLCGAVNEYFPWEMPVAEQMVICSAAITAVEFLSGVILNLWLGLGIWDYGGLPFNLLGQVCLPFSCAWLILGGAAILLDDYLRYWFFGEEKPRYIWRGKWILPVMQ